MKSITTKLFYTIAGVASVPLVVSGQGTSQSVGSKLDSPIGFETFGGVVAAIVSVVVQVGVVVVILAIIYSGFLFVTAQGNEEKITKAKKTFLWVIIGAIVLLGANELAEVVQNTASQFK